MAGNIYRSDYSQPPQYEEQPDPRYTSTPINEGRHEYDPLQYDEPDEEPQIRFSRGNAMLGRPLPDEPSTTLVSVRIKRRVGKRLPWTIVSVRNDSSFDNLFERFNQGDTLKIAKVRVGKEADAKVFNIIRDYQNLPVGDVVAMFGNHIEFSTEEMDVVQSAGAVSDFCDPIACCDDALTCLGCKHRRLCYVYAILVVVTIFILALVLGYIFKQSPRIKCTTTTCENGGRCHNLVNGFLCECNSGWNGTNCEININECATLPCLHGECIDGVNGFHCECPRGFDGFICQNNINECVSNPCLNDAICVDDINGYRCVCPTGYNGNHCQHNIDDCALLPCMHNATCIDGIDSFRCECPAGFDGKICQTNINECVSNPCLNDAFCVDDINGYECACPAGYHGQHCQNNIDECSSYPCRNDGLCLDGINGYTCQCHGGWNGTNCELKVAPITKSSGIRLACSSSTHFLTLVTSIIILALTLKGQFLQIV
ncbi:uncharacterized protein [Amphiura filiformis]|uniref:uncharacterized protein n=1 Tax=Amphiura filiformis TaxID=82378 RepID=UPI003B20B6D8